jgi:hypothetical protein
MELIREIIFPTENTYTLHLPEEMIGKQVEIIAFEIEKTPLESQKKNIDDIKAIFKDSLIDLSNYKFDRDEANNYED